MSNEEKGDRSVEVDTTDLDNLSKLIDKPVKNISSTGNSTIIEFADGELLTLQGGGAQILDYKEPQCSFCNRSKSQVGLLAAPPNKTNPLICSDCAVTYVELFASHGVEIKLNISKISPDLAKQIAGFTKGIGDGDV